MERDRELPGARDREHLGVRQPEGAGLGAVGACREDLHRAAVPGRRVEDRLPVGREARAPHLAAAKRQLMERRQRREPEPSAGEEAGGEARQEQADAQEGRPDATLRGDGGCQVFARDLAGRGRFGKVIAQVGQVAGQVARRPEPVFGILGEAPLDQPAQRSGRAGVHLHDRRGLLADDRRQGLGRRSSLERAFARRHLVEDRAEGELVGPEVERTPARLLGRHVADRSHHHPGARRVGGRLLHRQLVGLGRDELRQAEVQDLGVAVLGDHDVLGLQVPVHDPGGVGRGETVADLHGEVEHLLRRHRARGGQVLERRTLDQFHGDVDRRVRGTDVVDRQDVGVGKARGRARLPLKAGPAFGVRRELRGKHFHGDVAL